MKTCGGGGGGAAKKYKRVGGGGESPKSSTVIRGDHFSEVTFQRGDRLNFTLFSPKSSPLPPAINNDRSLIVLPW